ncbi:pro-sigmaK processing inhibitor BofA family protein [Methanosphaera cuniculi]|uniref:pro-sigmaK processing inhibitor BofA family protein n=1 Tax=Methanosphaera cuniculi TaxID=1077256 RepID=UPI0026F2373A|nr:pro-sigmaK processing inhibitor BofA family protein [Methanosphaera cuniculi]
MFYEILQFLIAFLVIIVALKIIFRYGGIILKILGYLVAGWILLFIANIIPGIFIPINLLTVVISGFGGVPGVLLLILLSLIA